MLRRRTRGILIAPGSRYKEWLKPEHWKWQKSFAWKPTKVKSGKWVWLTTVYTKHSITITSTELIQRKLAGEN